VVGFDGGEDEGLKMIQESNFSGVELSPFYVEIIQKIGKLNELFQVVTDYENDVLAYFYEVFRFEFQMSFNFYYTEMAANYYFKIEDDFRALNFYRSIQDPFGIVKILIILKNFEGIRKVLKDVGENISLDVVFDIACGIKGKKFAQKVLIELSNYIG
jgi:DNA modification methylase